MIDFYNLIARRKLNHPESWEWSSISRLGPDAVMVTGGIPLLLASGPNKGQRTWRWSEKSACVVTDAELAAEKVSYEATSGQCWKCAGAGQEFARWSASHGRETRPCRRCNSSGKAPKRAVK